MKHKYEICITSDPLISFLCLYPKKYKHKEIHTKKTLSAALYIRDKQRKKIECLLIRTYKNL